MARGLSATASRREDRRIPVCNFIVLVARGLSMASWRICDTVSRRAYGTDMLLATATIQWATRLCLVRAHATIRKSICSIAIEIQTSLLIINSYLVPIHCPQSILQP
jgi:hypothetical protein